MSTGSDVLVLAAIDALPHDSLLAFLSRQRWFAAKGAGPSAARIVDALEMPWGNGAFALARASVETASGTQVYQIPVAASRRAADVPERASVAHVMIGGAVVGLYDAMHDAEFRAGLGGALAAGLLVRGSDGHQWTAEPTTPGRLAGMASAVSTAGSAEQSNTSVVFGNTGIYKLFRLLKPGIHPDVEVTAFLTERARFPHTPALLANASFDDGGERTVAGMLQEYFPGSVDAWSHTLDRGRSYYQALVGREVDNPSIGEARTLGEITRELHEALACDEQDPAFAPEEVTAEDLDHWAQRTQQSIRDSLVMLERESQSAQFPGEHLAEAKALVRRVDHYVGWIDEIVDSVGDDLGERIRVHGDYHLGQVLRTAPGDFKIIDFEGEPSRGLAERREKASPLRDVAGMLRSYSYAAATLAMSVAEQVDPGTREIRSARWERDVRGAFLEGYLRARGAEDEPGILPEDARHIRQLVALFETEKAFYELAYELNNRPAWTWIPMRGIAKLFTR